MHLLLNSNSFLTLLPNLRLGLYDSLLISLLAANESAGGGELGFQGLKTTMQQPLSELPFLSFPVNYL
jgi:hypothetical protein